MSSSPSTVDSGGTVRGDSVADAAMATSGLRCDGGHNISAAADEGQLINELCVDIHDTAVKEVRDPIFIILFITVNYSMLLLLQIVVLIIDNILIFILYIRLCARNILLGIKRISITNFSHDALQEPITRVVGLRRFFPFFMPSTTRFTSGWNTKI